MDIFWVELLRLSLIQHYTYGGWQGTLEVQECLDGIFKLLRLDPSIFLIQHLEASQLLVLGESLTRWARPRSFPDTDSAQQLSISTACGHWHDDEGHFLTFYISKDYWSLMDPLRDLSYPPSGIHYRLHSALSESLRARILPVPTLPQYRQTPQIAIHQGKPRLA
jgi:hypothetical protein